MEKEFEWTHEWALNTSRQPGLSRYRDMLSVPVPVTDEM